MKRKTVIFSLLLLPLWLAAVAFSISAVPDADANSDQISRTPDDQSGPNTPAKDLPPLKHAAHHLARRAAFSAGTGDDLLSGNAPTSTLPSPPLLGAVFSVVEAPANLRHSWQFHLRSASEPRAPSSIS